MRVHGKTNIHQIDCIKNPCSLPTILQNNTLDNKLVKYPHQGCINQVGTGGTCPPPPTF